MGDVEINFEHQREYFADSKKISYAIVNFYLFSVILVLTIVLFFSEEVDEKELEKAESFFQKVFLCFH